MGDLHKGVDPFGRQHVKNEAADKSLSSEQLAAAKAELDRKHRKDQQLTFGLLSLFALGLAFAMFFFLFA